MGEVLVQPTINTITMKKRRGRDGDLNAYAMSWDTRRIGICRCFFPGA
jgi:hypothetical protein